MLAAYQFVAELLAIALDHPGDSARQGVVVLPRADWQPDPTFLATVTGARRPERRCCTPSTLDQWFRDVAVGPAGPPARWLPPIRPTSFASPRAWRSPGLVWHALASMLPATDPLPTDSGMAAASVQRRQRSRPRPASRISTPSTASSNELADAVDPVPPRRITLASRTTEVPITLHRRIDGPIQVRLHLESPKLSFPQNDILVTLDAETVQERVSVQARANGTVPLTVRIITPHGDLSVAPATELTVHATTLSGFGVVLTVGALLVLATWWVRHIRRTRRQKATAGDGAASSDRRPRVGLGAVGLGAVGLASVASDSLTLPRSASHCPARPPAPG